MILIKNKKMKKIILIILLSGFASIGISQNSNNDQLFNDDNVLNNVIRFIPKGWMAKVNEGVLIIERTDSIWILEENWLQNPREDKAERNKRVISKGKRSTSYVKIEFEQKWSSEKLANVKTENNAYTKLLNELPEKHKITELGTQLSGKKMSGVTYMARTNDDKKRLANYYKEKENIEKLIRKIPDMNSENYSLFVADFKGCIDDNHYIYPCEASVELYTILNNFRELCNK
jgi:hypothetical protein